mgnify:FL=1
MTNSEFQALLDEAYSHQKLMAKLNAISYEIIELSKVQQKNCVDRILHAFKHDICCARPISISIFGRTDITMSRNMNISQNIEITKLSKIGTFKIDILISYRYYHV